MKSTMIIAFVGAAVATLALSSCNTVAGAGQDIRQGGAAISNAANDAAR